MHCKIMAIVNPHSAGKRTQKQWPQIRRVILDNQINFDYKYTEYPMHAEKLTREAINMGYETIISVGGDGTLNEVINGFFDDGILINQETKLAVLSLGTGCDFIRSLGISTDVYALIKTLKKGKQLKCDIGKVKFNSNNGNISERFFINVSDIGIGGETTYRVNKTSKIFRGFLSFLVTAVISIIFYKNKMFNIYIDDKKIKGIKNSIFVCNGRYFGGGMMIAPRAELNDGFFDVIVLDKLNKFQLIKYLPLIYKGEHIRIKEVSYYKSKKVSVRCDEKALLEIDGEQVGKSNAEFIIYDNMINILVYN